MHIVTPSSCSNEAVATASPQGIAAGSEDVSLELTALSADQPGAVAALMRTLAEVEARALSAEQQLAAHHRHCICRAAQVAAEAGEQAAALQAAA